MLCLVCLDRKLLYKFLSGQKKIQSIQHFQGEGCGDFYFVKLGKYKLLCGVVLDTIKAWTKAHQTLKDVAPVMGNYHALLVKEGTLTYAHAAHNPKAKAKDKRFFPRTGVDVKTPFIGDLLMYHHLPKATRSTDLTDFAFLEQGEALKGCLGVLTAPTMEDATPYIDRFLRELSGNPASFEGYEDAIAEVKLEDIRAPKRKATRTVKDRRRKRRKLMKATEATLKTLGDQLKKLQKQLKELQKPV